MSDNNKNILVFTDWFLPGYKAGGPIRSLANLINTLRDVKFYVVTRNTDHFSNDPYPDVQSNTWVTYSENCEVYYFDEQNISLKAIKLILTEKEFSKVYLNSLFSPKFTLLPLIAIRKLGLRNKCILAPRGMLKPGALSVKARKKKVFLSVSKMIGLYNGITWHATSNEEITEVKTHFPNTKNIKIAPNIAAPLGNKPMKSTKQPGELKLICIARISKEKGIIEALTYLRDASLSGIVDCDFYGTIQNQNFYIECKELATSIKNVSISFKGEIPPHEIEKALKSYHFFYLPTLGENFGHAIAEALNSATPIIISNKTPWQNIELQNAGWDLELESDLFGNVLRSCLNMGNEEYQKKSESAYQLASKVSSDSKIIDAQYALFQ